MELMDNLHKVRMLIQKIFTFYYYPAESISNPSSVTFLLTKTEMNSTSLPRFPVDIESENKHTVIDC